MFGVSGFGSGLRVKGFKGTRLGLQSASKHTPPRFFWESWWADGWEMVGAQKSRLIIGEMHHGTRSESDDHVPKTDFAPDCGTCLPTHSCKSFGPQPPGLGQAARWRHCRTAPHSQSASTICNGKRNLSRTSVPKCFGTTLKVLNGNGNGP